MRPGDLDEVLAIERESFTMPWSRGAFLYEIEQNRVAHCHVVRDGETIGRLPSACGRSPTRSTSPTSPSIPRTAAAGIARDLLTGLIADARARDLRMWCSKCVRATSTRFTLYESFGFRVTGRRRGYYYAPARTRSSWRTRLVTRPPTVGGNQRTGCRGLVGREFEGNARNLNTKGEGAPRDRKDRQRAAGKTRRLRDLGRTTSRWPATTPSAGRRPRSSEVLRRSEQESDDEDDATALLTVVVAVVTALPTSAAAETMDFKLLMNYSQANFRSDASLETFVGISARGHPGHAHAGSLETAGGPGSTVRVDMNRVTTGIEKRDADMRSKRYLDTEVDANRWGDVSGAEGRDRGPLEVRQASAGQGARPADHQAEAGGGGGDASIMYMRLTPGGAGAAKAFRVRTDNIKVRAKLNTTSPRHGMQIPQILFLRSPTKLQIATDLVFARTQ